MKIVWFRKIIRGPEPDALARNRHVIHAREHDDGRRRLPLVQVLQNRKTIHARHPKVEEHQVELLFLEYFDCFFAITHCFHVEAFEREMAFHQLAQRLFVIGIQ